jgi:transcriptional regulator with XRE-family HTH domain
VGLTQKQLAQTLGMEQGDLSKLERRQNLHLATLTRFIEATGGRLRITAVYGDTEVALDINDVVPSRDTDVRAGRGQPQAPGTWRRIVGMPCMSPPCDLPSSDSERSVSE